MRRTFRHMLACLLALSMALTLTVALADTTVTTADELAQAVQNGGTVILGASITGSITIPEGGNVTLNLNSFTLTNTANQHTITNKGTLTITGEGTVDNVSNGRAAVYNDAGATVTLSGGAYKRSQEKGTSSGTGGNTYYTLKNFGKMTIEENVTVENSGSYSSMIANGWQSGGTAGQPGKEPAVQNGGAELVINGGTFTGGLNTIKNDDYGTLTITDGTFENFTQAAFLNWNVATVTGGIFNAGSHVAILNSWGDNTLDKGQLTITNGQFSGARFLQTMDGRLNIGTVEITGGTFEGGMYIKGDTDGGTVKISGGSFLETTPSTWTTDNATLTVSGGEYGGEVPQQYVVTGSTSVSLTSNGDTTYYIGTPEQVAASVGKAANGDTITVLSGSLTLTNPAVGVTIANKGDGQVSAGGQAVAKNGSVTIAAPVEPVDPVEPVEPVEPAKPVEPVEPVETTAPAASVPKTGDASQPLLWAALLLISAGAAAAFLFMKKRYQ